MRRFFRDNSLSLVAFGLFLLTLLGHSLAGHRAHNSDRLDHGAEPLSYRTYLGSGHFIESVAENWESAFLELAVFVVLGKYLRQKGSAESRDPDDQRRVPSYWRQGPRRCLYAHSLSITLAGLFVMSFCLHAYGGSRKYSESELAHGQNPVTAAQYVLTSSFWFESFQNWQSEFLSVGALAVLTIYLREAGSPSRRTWTRLMNGPKSERPRFGAIGCRNNRTLTAQRSVAAQASIPPNCSNL